ncbi:MAG: glycosyltransferase [Pseudonocardiaceae bacterium]
MNAPMRPLRLAMVVPSARREGGGDIWLDQLLHQLSTPEIRPLVVFEEGGELERCAASYDCHTTVLLKESSTGCDDVSGLVAPLAGVLAAQRPDVTVFWSPRAQLYGARAHRSAGQPGRTAWVQHVMPSTFWLHRDASTLPTDLVVCVSTAVRRRQQDLYPQHPTCVVHPGVPVPQSGLSRSAARMRLRYLDSRPLIGVVGRIEPWKGQDVAVAMLSELTSHGVDAHLVLLGQQRSPTWPEFGAEVQRRIDELGLSHQVTFVGHVHDVPAVLPALDVLVCASREEGFGLAIVEAMATGIPVVTTACGGPADVIDDELTGLLVPVEDPVALAEAVRRLLQRPAFAAQLTSRARRVWQDRFTEVHSAEAFRAAVTDLGHINLLPTG